MNKEFIYIEEKKDGHKIRKVYRQLNNYKPSKCVWKKVVLNRGTTSETWDEDHKCVKCRGYDVSCENYIGIEENE